MRTTGERATAAAALAALSAVLASSCSAPVRNDVDMRPALRSTAPRPRGQITQLDFGRQAAFTSCLPPACPAVTPKTLASVAPAAPAELPAPVALPVSRAIDPTASLGRGETLVARQASVPPQRAALAALAATTPSAPQPEPATEPVSRQVVVHFAFGSAALSPAARASIDEVADALPAARRIAVTGRTDSVGPPLVNEALALARANAARDHLRARYPNLAPTLTLQAKGACCFAATNDTAQGRALNRRVEIIFERDGQDL